MGGEKKKLTWPEISVKAQNRPSAPSAPGRHKLKHLTQLPFNLLAAINVGLTTWRMSLSSVFWRQRKNTCYVLIWFCLHFGNEFFKYIVGISVWLMYMYIYVWIKLRWTVIQGVVTDPAVRWPFVVCPKELRKLKWDRFDLTVTTLHKLVERG